MISGAGGAMSKGGRAATSAASQPKPYVPREDANSLFSTSYAKVLDLIGEGEIQGLVDGHRSIYLNNTPLQNADGSYNFQGLTIELRNGTQVQQFIPGFGEVVSETAVGVTVTKNAPVTRTITNTLANAARVVVTVPALQSYTDKGDILGTDLQLQIAVQYNGGGYTTVVDDTISGRTSQQYQRQYLIGLSGAFPVDIKVTRITDDSTSSKLANAFSWSSFSTVTYAKLAYPNSALVGLRVDAEQFNSIPTRSYRVRGIKVRIPSNATVDSTTGRLIYSGVWDGSFGAAQWTSDPAWCLWDLLTSSRYGAGDHLDISRLDRWAFYAASQYASALVPDGFGGTEPRFSCSCNIQTADDAYRLINDLCSVFRAMPYWSAGSLTASQDRASDPAFLFTPANVGPEGFSYSGSSLKTRPTVAVVKYFDLDLRDYAYEVIEDADGIARYGAVRSEIEAFACTRRGQAHRIGKWLLYSEAYEREVVSFTSALAAGALVRPGQVISIADPVRAGARRGGRIAAATTTAITVDDATGLVVANSPVLSALLSDGATQTRGVVSISGNVITVATAFSSAPPSDGVWLFESSNIQASTWRVLGIEERDGISYAISAIAYNASKYNYVEQGLAIEKRDITDLNILPDPPSNLTAIEVLYEAGSRVLAKLQVSWSAVPGASFYRVTWREANGNWLSQTTPANGFEILDTHATSYEIQVSTVGAGLLGSQPTRLTVQAYGKTAPPVTPTGLNLIPIDAASAVLSWDQAPDLDVRIGGRVLIRHSPVLSGAAWEDSTELVEAIAGNQSQKQIPLLTGTVLVKFEDDTGNRSVDAALVVVTRPTPQPLLLVREYAEEDETPAFSGNYTNMVYSGNPSESGGFTGISIATGAPWDGLDLIDSDELVDGGPNDPVEVLPSGEYEFGSSYSFPGVFDVSLRRHLMIRSFLLGDSWDSDELMDGTDAVDGLRGDRTNVATYVRTTEADPEGTPAWGPWAEFANAIVRGRGFQFKAIATSDDPMQNLVIAELGADLELQQRTEQSEAAYSGASTCSVTFTNPFLQPPSVGVTAYDMGTGDYFTVANVTRLGFQLTFRNSSANAVNRRFTYAAIGFGREIT